MKRHLPFVLFLLAFTVAVVAARLWGRGLFEVDGLLQLLGHAPTGVALLLGYLAVFGVSTALVPAFLFYVVGGALWGFWPGWLIGWCAANVWSHTHFAVGRWFGRERVSQWFESPRLATLRSELETGGVTATLVVRQLPLPFVAVNAAAGASPMPWWRFTVGNALGLLPGALIYTWSSTGIVAGAAGARAEAGVRILIAAVGVAVLGAVSRALQRRLVRPRP